MGLVVGVGGMGKSVFIDQVEKAREAKELPTRVVSARVEPDAESLEHSAGLDAVALLVVEDAHLLSPLGIERLLRLAEQRQPRECGLLVTLRPLGLPGPSRLRELAADSSSMVQLEEFSAEEVAELCHAVLRTAVPSRIVETLIDATGGHPLLVERAIRLGLSVESDRPSPDVLAAVASRVGQMSAEDRAVLGAFAIVGPLILDDHPEAVDRLRLAGLLPQSGVLAPLGAAVVRRVLTTTETNQSSVLVLSSLRAHGATPLAVAEQLVTSGALRPEHAEQLVSAGDELLAADPKAALEWFERAVALDSGSPDAQAAKAQALLLLGREADAVAVAAGVLRARAAQPRALAVLAGSYAVRGLWTDAAETLAQMGTHPHGRSGQSAGLDAASELLCSVLAEQAGADPAPAPDRSDVSSRVVREAAELLLATRSFVDGDITALPDVLRRFGRRVEHLALDPSLPVTPHEVGAVAALAAGELRLARAIIESAPSVAVRRAALDRLAAWIDVRLGAEASQVGDADTDDADIVTLATEAAVARRAGDVTAGSRLARGLAAVTATADPDLLNLDAAAELLVLSRRFRVGNVSEEFGARVERFLDRLGRPPLCTARVAWCGLEAAAAVRDVEAARLHADALVRLGELVPGLRPLAAAAAVWPGVLENQPDIDAVRSAITELRDSGYVWEAARLAGQTAIRVDNAEQAKSLLGEARTLRANQRSEVASSEDQITPAGLSEREIEVAERVLNGMSYKEIGSTLYISAKTVEHHVANIRRKLGVSGGNRADFLAALKDDLGLAV